MKIKVSDYIVNFFNKNNIDSVFSVTGGFSMHLSDSFFNNKNYKIYYQYHEQACTYSAIGYYYATKKIPIICTTAGCAVVNTLSPCLDAYQDSVPILIIGGQVKSTETINTLNNNDMKLRHYAGADCDIVSMAKECTKFSYEINNLNNLEEILIEAMNNLINGRKGPVLLSIPLDLQAMIIEVNDEYKIVEEKLNFAENNVEDLNKIYSYLNLSSRPIIIAGNGIKLGNCKDKFIEFINKYKIPVLTTMMSTDIIENDNELFIGRLGVIGQRAGNFALQNSDLVISLGCRMAQGVVGYRSDWFAREAKIIYVDIDKNELKKNNVSYNEKINMDLNYFFSNYNYNINDYSIWNNKCLYWKKKWMNELPLNINDSNGVNPYVVLDKFFDIAPENKIITCSSGSIVTVLWHKVNIKKNDKFIISSQGDMGFELPSAIGASFADKNNMVITISGEGAFQLHIQELQTIVHHKLPIKILLFNNGGYGANVITQSTFFNSKYGCDPESDLSFPCTEKIAQAYGIKYLKINKNEEIENICTEFLNYKEAIILEVFCCIQPRTPKLSAFKNEDGTFTNRPFEDMEPFMDREKFKKEMIVNIV